MLEHQISDGPMPEFLDTDTTQVVSELINISSSFKNVHLVQVGVYRQLQSSES